MVEKSVLRRRALFSGLVVLVVAVVAAAFALVAALQKPPLSWSAPAAAVSAAATPGAGTGSSPPSASAAASANSSQPVMSGRARRGGSGAKLRQVDGGPGFYAKFSSSLPRDESFFPVGVWQESVLEKADTDKDRDAGLNTYVAPTDNSDLSVIDAAGMQAISSAPHQNGPATAGWFVSDEVDMWGGPGDGAWTGNYPGSGDVCNPSTAKCGYTIQKTLLKEFPADGRLRYSNYGKGVMFWESDAEASRFVNQFQDVVSADTYFFTDVNICGATEGGTLFGNKPLPPEQCRRASNYGGAMDRLRGMVSPAGSRPVWAFVEVGHPASESDAPTIKPAQVTAAVWSSVIHGARGVVYFNHSFGGPCPTQHALREPCYQDVRAAVKRVNGQLRTLAPVLNAKTADGVVKPTAGVDVAAKWYDGHFYLLAGSNQNGAQTATFSLPCVGDATVTVIDENRGLRVAGGQFSDRFADGNAVHIYRIDGGSSCGAY
jgi:hypothetical protein